MFNPNDYLIKLKGKDYLQVVHRMQWFNENYPIESGWRLVTKELFMDDEKAIYRAELINPEGVVIRTGTKVEHKRDFPDFVEKAETGSIGRCLGLAGFGTAYCAEFEEGERIVDAPVEIKSGSRKEAPKEAPKDKEEPKEEDVNAPIVKGTIKTIGFMIGRLQKKNKEYDVEARVKEFGKDKIEDLTQSEGDQIIKEINEIMAS